MKTLSFIGLLFVSLFSFLPFFVIVFGLITGTVEMSLREALREGKLPAHLWKTMEIEAIIFLVILGGLFGSIFIWSISSLINHGIR